MRKCNAHLVYRGNPIGHYIHWIFFYWIGSNRLYLKGLGTFCWFRKRNIFIAVDTLILSLRFLNLIDCKLWYFIGFYFLNVYFNEWYLLSCLRNLSAAYTQCENDKSALSWEQTLYMASYRHTHGVTANQTYIDTSPCSASFNVLKLQIYYK